MASRSAELPGLTEKQRRAYVLRLNEPTISDREAGQMLGITGQSFNRLYKTALRRIEQVRRTMVRSGVFDEAEVAQRLDDYLRKVILD
jgi:transcriptional regulator